MHTGSNLVDPRIYDNLIHVPGGLAEIMIWIQNFKSPEAPLECNLLYYLLEYLRVSKYVHTIVHTRGWFSKFATHKWLF